MDATLVVVIKQAGRGGAIGGGLKAGCVACVCLTPPVLLFTHFYARVFSSLVAMVTMTGGGRR